MIYRYKLSSIAVVWACMAWAVSAAEPPLTPFRTATQSEQETLWAPAADGVEAPTDLSHEVRCSAEVFRTADVDLRWHPVAAAEGGEQRVDLSKFRDGFEKGRFETSGALEASRDGARLTAPEPGVHYYWRVVRQTEAGWVSSPTARFEVPVCPWDEPADPSLPAAHSNETAEGGRR